MRFFRLMSQVHLWLGVAVGIQVMLWLISGLAMVLWPIEIVRGEHLRTPAEERAIDWAEDALPLADILAAQDSDVVSVRTGWLAGDPVWRLETGDGPQMIDARTGADLTPVDEVLARRIALTRYTGTGELQDQTLVETPPREAGLTVPAWRFEFGPADPATLYINSQTGELRAVRTTLWRVYDWFWGVHIMDWSTRENFNSWWIKVTSLIAILFGLAGVILTVLRLRTMIRRRR
ncbi:hypothetical protein [Maricaulis sp.]|uniref:PepSY domain-containing protein n=1 Tax=Maricaulis sp. TaxID=1486257 RepID=UPI00260BBE04|nr:hypothetical protein [Maricaulis sp.]